MAKEELKKYIAEANEDMLFVLGLDDAIIGYIERAGTSSIALYDKNKVIHILMDQGYSEEEAIDSFYYNIIGASYGENTPGFATFVGEGDI